MLKLIPYMSETIMKPIQMEASFPKKIPKYDFFKRGKKSQHLQGKTGKGIALKKSNSSNQTVS